MAGAGVQSTNNVDADVSSFTIDGLQSDSAYSILVSSLTGNREGSPSTLSVRTGTSAECLIHITAVAQSVFWEEHGYGGKDNTK